MKPETQSGQVWSQSLVASSPLRRADPRTKLALSLGVSLATMLPLERLAAALGLYALLLGWARLWQPAARQIWRLKWVLGLLFLLDWLLISLDLAVIVTMRLILLAGAFTLFFATTTPDEMRLALEWMGVPYRYAFSLSLAFQSINVLDEEWRAIREAQRSRGAWAPLSSWKKLPGYVRELVALGVPAIVMTAKRAWAMTEAAYARGFDSPHRRPYHRLAMGRLDWLLLGLALAAGAGVTLWRCQLG
jgi:energy-coupling factor transporter transmembrane protein EcfT